MVSDVVSRHSSVWQVVRRLGWRFALIYPVLYALPFPIDLLPQAEAVMERYEHSEARVSGWFGRAVLGVSVDHAAPFTGSGDRAIDYLSAVMLAVLSLVGAALWTALERHDRHEARVAGGVRVYLRYAMAFTMLSYGLAKVYESQFPTPNDAWLATRFGDASPMRLLWTFMGT